MEKETSFVGDVKLRTFWGRWKDSRWEMKPNAIEIYVNNKLKYKFDLKTYQVTASVSFDKSIKVSFIKKRESTNLFINPPTDKHAYWIHVILENSKKTSEIKIEDFADAVILADNKGNILQINKLSEELFGYSQEEIVGQNVKILMPASIAKYHDTYLQQFNKTSKRTLLGKPRVLPVVHKNGNAFNVILNLGITFEFDETRFIGIFIKIDNLETVSPVYLRFLESNNTKTDINEDSESEDWSDDTNQSNPTSAGSFNSKSVYLNLLSFVEFTPFRPGVRESVIPSNYAFITRPVVMDDSDLVVAKRHNSLKAGRSLSTPVNKKHTASNIEAASDDNITEFSDIELSEYSEDKINDQISITRYSFIHKTDINFKKDTALHLACETKQWEIAIQLLEYGADPNAIRSFKFTNATIKQTPFEIILEYFDLDEISTDIFFAKCVEKFLSVGYERKIGRLFVKKHNYKLYTYACILSTIATKKNYLILPNLKITSINFLNRYYHQFSQFLLELDLSFNKLDELSSDISKLPNLTSLNLSNNLLKYLPKSLTALEDLIILNVKGNPLDIPKSVVKAGCRTILQYVAENNQENNPIFDESLNEIKVVILGDKKAGKTSIANIIADSFKIINKEKDQTKITQENTLSKNVPRPRMASNFHTVSFLDIKVGTSFQVKKKSFVVRGKPTSDKRMDYFEDMNYYKRSSDGFQGGSITPLPFHRLDRKSSVNIDSPKKEETSSPVGFLSLLSNDQRESFIHKPIKNAKHEEIKKILKETLSDKDNGILEFKDRKSKKFLHKNQFSGSDLVDWILSVVTKHKIDRQKAAYFAQMLIEEVLIKGTGKYENKFKDSLKTFYFINDNEKSVIVNAFDFTALNLKNPNYYFHLSDYTLYLLVFDITKQGQDKRLDKWMEIITDKSKHISVLIIATHTDALPEYSTIEDITNILLDFDDKLAVKYPQIKGITAISCKSGFGHSHLRSMLKNEIFHITDTFKAPYHTGQLLSSLLVDTIDFPLLSWSDMTSRLNYYEMNIQQIHQSLSYLHNTGSLFYHSKSFIFANWKQLNYLFVLIYNSQRVDSAVITSNNLIEIWKAQDERLIIHYDLLVSMFCSIGVMIMVSKDLFIIPFLLPTKFTDKKMNLAASNYYNTLKNSNNNINNNNENENSDPSINDSNNNNNNNNNNNTCFYFNNLMRLKRDKKKNEDEENNDNDSGQSLFFNKFIFDEKSKNEENNNNKSEENESESDDDEKTDNINNKKKKRSWSSASLSSARKNKKIIVREYFVNCIPTNLLLKIIDRVLEIFKNTSNALYYIWEFGIIIYLEKYRFHIEFNIETKIILFELWMIDKKIKKEAYFVFLIIMDSIRTLLTHWYTTVKGIITFIPCSNCSQYLSRKIAISSIDPHVTNPFLSLFEISDTLITFFEEESEENRNLFDLIPKIQLVYSNSNSSLSCPFSHLKEEKQQKQQEKQEQQPQNDQQQTQQSQEEQKQKLMPQSSETFKHKPAKKQNRSLNRLQNKKSTFKIRRVPSRFDEINCETCHSGKKNSLDLEFSYFNFSPNIDEEEIEKAQTLGQGAFGIVKKLSIQDPKCKDQFIDIAVKIFSDFDAVSYSDILREIWIMQMIKSHPNVVKIIGVTKKPFAIQMQLVPKGDLYSYLHNTENPDMSWLLRFKIVKEISSAMHYLHSFSPPLIHRDLKSPNILMMSDNAKDEINTKLSDFGLTQFLYSDGIKQLTENRDVQNLLLSKFKLKLTLYTAPTWLAPEIIFGHPHNEKVDCYALGIIMWEMLTREHPFSEFQNKNNLQFVTEEIIKSAKRPKIPDRYVFDYAPKAVLDYVSLMEQLWDQVPSNRPSFRTVMRKVEPYIEAMEKEEINY